MIPRILHFDSFLSEIQKFLFSLSHSLGIQLRFFPFLFHFIGIGDILNRTTVGFFAFIFYSLSDAY